LIDCCSVLRWAGSQSSCCPIFKLLSISTPSAFIQVEFQLIQATVGWGGKAWTSVTGTKFPCAILTVLLKNEHSGSLANIHMSDGAPIILPNDASLSSAGGWLCYQRLPWLRRTQGVLVVCDQILNKILTENSFKQKTKNYRRIWEHSWYWYS